MQLTQRQTTEQVFHDQWAETLEEVLDYRPTFESPTAIENKHALLQLGDIQNKKILDLGCGLGDATLYFASCGAQVYATDISPKMIEYVKKQANLNHFSNIQAQVMPAEKLEFPNEFFDFVYGNGVLHHVEIDETLPEVNRVLKTNGIATFVEPLSHNPIINIYRKMANEVRTVSEKPLKYNEIESMTKKAGFITTHHQEFHLLTLTIFIWYFIVSRVSPNEERYWKKIINEGNQIKDIFSFLYTSEKFLLKTIPPLRKFCWNTVITLRKT